MSNCSCNVCAHEMSVEPTTSAPQGVFKSLWQTQRRELLVTVLGLILFGATFAFKRQLGDTLPYAYGAILLLTGGTVFTEAIKSLARGHGMDETFLMSVVAIGAFCIGQYPEAVAVMLFYQVGELFSGQAVNSSRNAISALVDMRPKTVHLLASLDSSATTTVAAQSISISSYIQVKPGEQVPLDGEIVRGQGSMNTAFLTGESLPRAVKPGDAVEAGFINGPSPLTIKTTSKFENSAIARILNLLENSSAKKAKQDLLIKRFARIYTPLVVAAACVVGLAVPSILALPVVGVGTFSLAFFSPWIYKALLFLVVSCPCALVISVPLTYFASIGACAKQGILIKSQASIEQLAHPRIVLFDKTGTLTTGAFSVESCHWFPSEQSETTVLQLAAELESHSTHPLAQCIARYAHEAVSASANPPSCALTSITEVPGRGVQGTYDNEIVSLGNAAFVSERITPEEKNQLTSLTEKQSGQLIYMTLGNQLIMAFELSDTIKPGAQQTITQLKKHHIETIMLTGDECNTAQRVAQTVGVNQVYAQLLPAQKVELVERFSPRDVQGFSLFCGDGINDAPSLARADVGIAMGGLGSDAAIEAADAVLTNDNIEALIPLIQTAKKTVCIVRQNITVALIVKLGIMILGLLGIATMWAAVVGDVGVTIALIFNSLRALRTRKDTHEDHEQLSQRWDIYR